MATEARRCTRAAAPVCRPTRVDWTNASRAPTRCPSIQVGAQSSCNRSLWAFRIRRGGAVHRCPKVAQNHRSACVRPAEISSILPISSQSVGGTVRPVGGGPTVFGSGRNPGRRPALPVGRQRPYKAAGIRWGNAVCRSRHLVSSSSSCCPRFSVHQILQTSRDRKGDRRWLPTTWTPRGRRELSRATTAAARRRPDPPPRPRRRGGGGPGRRRRRPAQATATATGPPSSASAPRPPTPGHSSAGSTAPPPTATARALRPLPRPRRSDLTQPKHRVSTIKKNAQQRRGQEGN